MVERRPNAIGLAIMATLYWGALFYWLRSDLLDGAADEFPLATIEPHKPSSSTE